MCGRSFELPKNLDSVTGRRLSRQMCGKAPPFRAVFLIFEAMPPNQGAEAEPRKKDMRCSESHRLSAHQPAKPVPNSRTTVTGRPYPPQATVAACLTPNLLACA